MGKSDNERVEKSSSKIGGHKNEGVAAEESNANASELQALIFPKRLMTILANVSNRDCICWSTDGCSFCIVDQDLFAERIMPRVSTRKSKFSSFLRKLNRWGFSLVTKGPNMGNYQHDFFRRTEPHLASQMFYYNQRTKEALKSNPGAPGAPRMDLTSSLVEEGPHKDTTVVQAKKGRADNGGGGQQLSLSHPVTHVQIPEQAPAVQARLRFLRWKQHLRQQQLFSQFSGSSSLKGGRDGAMWLQQPAPESFFDTRNNMACLREPELAVSSQDIPTMGRTGVDQAFLPAGQVLPQHDGIAGGMSASTTLHRNMFSSGLPREQLALGARRSPKRADLPGTLPAAFSHSLSSLLPSSNHTSNDARERIAASLAGRWSIDGGLPRQEWLRPSAPSFIQPSNQAALDVPHGPAYQPRPWAQFGQSSLAGLMDDNNLRLAAAAVEARGIREVSHRSRNNIQEEETAVEAYINRMAGKDNT